MRRETFIVVIVVVAIVAVFGFVALAASNSGQHGDIQKAGASAAPSQDASGTSAGDQKILVLVFFWSGGGASNDIRNSQTFDVEGGHQVLSFNGSDAGGAYGLSPFVEFAIRPADGRSGQEPISPPATGHSESDLYLPAGSYYVYCNTLDCLWSMTITEKQ